MLERVGSGENKAKAESVVGIIEKKINGCLLPSRDFKLSDSDPTIGSDIASIAIATAKTIPTSAAERPRTCEK